MFPGLSGLSCPLSQDKALRSESLLCVGLNRREEVMGCYRRGRAESGVSRAQMGGVGAGHPWKPPTGPIPQSRGGGMPGSGWGAEAAGRPAWVMGSIFQWQRCVK